MDASFSIAESGLKLYSGSQYSVSQGSDVRDDASFAVFQSQCISVSLRVQSDHALFPNSLWAPTESDHIDS